MISLPLVPVHDDSQGHEGRDRLELLTTMIDGPGFDPLLRNDIIDVPRDHPALHWNCLVRGCGAQIRAQELCKRHVEQWNELQAAGMERLEFLRTAGPVEDAKSWLLPVRPCRILDCARPARRGVAAALCGRHMSRWQAATGSIRINTEAAFAVWLRNERPYASFGECVAVCCSDLARSPIGFCEFHERCYRVAGCPGHAVLPSNWGRWYDHETGGTLPVAYDDARRSDDGASWCHRHRGPAASASSACIRWSRRS